MNSTHTVPGVQSALRLAMGYKGRRAKTWGEGYDRMPVALQQEKTDNYLVVRDRFELLYKTPRQGVKVIITHIEEENCT